MQIYIIIINLFIILRFNNQKYLSMCLKKSLFLFIGFLSLFVFNACSDEPSSEQKVSGIKVTLHDNSYNPLKINYQLDDLLQLPEFEAPDAYVLEKNFEVNDPINNRSWTYDIFLPPSYNEAPDRKYPVLFLLHGINSKPLSWYKDMQIKKIIDYFHEYFNLEEMVVIMPYSENTYYVDNFQEDTKYESFFIENFVPYILSQYRIRENTGDHLIAGFSMGGYGCLSFALKYGDIFGFSYSMSGPIDGHGKTGTVESLIDLMDIQHLSNQIIILDVGLSDSFSPANVRAHNKLDELKYPHIFLLRQGKHDSQFWTESSYILFTLLKDYLN